MKLLKKDIECLEILIEHAIIDISYGESGTYNSYNPKTMEFPFDSKKASKANQAIKIIKSLISKNTTSKK